MSQLENDILKPLTVTPVTEGVDPQAKANYGVVRFIRKLKHYISLPSKLLAPTNEKRHLLFQWNVSISEDFFLADLPSLVNHQDTYIAGGCLCIKWISGGEVYRYVLLDSYPDEQWHYFDTYVNQRIPAGNITVEFYENAVDDLAEVGIKLGGITFQTSKLSLPVYATDTDSTVSYGLSVDPDEFIFPWATAVARPNTVTAY